MAQAVVLVPMLAMVATRAHLPKARSAAFRAIGNIAYLNGRAARAVVAGGVFAAVEQTLVPAVSPTGL